MARPQCDTPIVYFDFFLKKGVLMGFYLDGALFLWEKRLRKRGLKPIKCIF
jgi:hypothetical protein